MRLILLTAVLFSAACVRRYPGSADVAAAPEYKSSAGTRSARSELAGRVLATIPGLRHDEALDEVAKVLAEDFGTRHEFPGPLYVQELLWRRGSTARCLYAVHAWSTRSAGVAHLDSLLAARLETMKDLEGKTFGLHRTRIAYVMLIAETPIVLEGLPAQLAPSQSFTL